MKTPKVPKFLLVFPMVAFLAGCYPNKVDFVDEYDLAGTLYDEAADFSSYATFTVADTVMHMTEDGEDDPNFTREHDQFILDLIRENMRNNGYNEITDPDSLDNRPDLVLFVEALSSDFYQYWGYWWDYWYWYPWYPGYPWYPSYPWNPGYVTSYTTGTLMVTMMDSENWSPEDERIDVIWTGLVDGLLSGSASNARGRLEKQINQLFTQSEYLDQN
jgi:hypothetical protein